MGTVLLFPSPCLYFRNKRTVPVFPPCFLGKTEPLNYLVFSFDENVREYLASVKNPAFPGYRIVLEFECLKDSA